MLFSDCIREEAVAVTVGGGMEAPVPFTRLQENAGGLADAAFVVKRPQWWVERPQ